MGSSNRRDFVKTSLAGAAALTALSSTTRAASERPNILWLVSEDNSPWLGCYGDPVADTPNLDRMAAEGVRYTNAFANAPVCAPARSTLHTGMYASSLGTLHMRSCQPLPENVRFFTAHLRDAGYRCINGQKTDYNTTGTPKDAWDERRLIPSFKGLGAEPFFMFINYMTTHESSLHKTRELTHNPAKVQLAPHHPDTPVIRHDYAQYHDRITLLDAQIGEALADLEAAGLAEDTIVIYFSDHGGVLPWSKRFLSGRGTRVPLIMRFPDKFKHLMPPSPGSAVDRLVSFVDFGPTALSLAGVPVPENMQGRPFLGEGAAPAPDYVHCYRGRMDERYDMSRSVCDGRFNYIRNYYPHLAWGRHLDYLWKMPAMQSWEEEYKAGRCNEVQSRFFGPKPMEELYDQETDPHEVNNLVNDPDYGMVLDHMRAENRRFLEEVRDPGFLSESEMTRRAEGGSPAIMAADPARYDLERIMEAAELAGERDPANVGTLTGWLTDRDSAVRYWGAVGLAALADRAGESAGALQKALEDSSPAVVVAAAGALGRMGHGDEAMSALRRILLGRDIYAGLEAADAVYDLDQYAGPLDRRLAQHASSRATRRIGLNAIR